MAMTEERLNSLRERISRATSARARAEAEHDAAVRDRAAALADLQEFGVSTGQDAASLMARLEADLEKAVADVEQALAEAGA